MARRGGPRIPRFAYLCPRRRAAGARGFRLPDEGPDTHPRNGHPMSAQTPYERFRLSARRAPGPGPAHVPGIASFAGAHTHPGHPPRNGYPMTGQIPYGGFRMIHPGGPKPPGAPSPAKRKAMQCPQSHAVFHSTALSRCARKPRKIPKNGHLAYTKFPKDWPPSRGHWVPL